MGDEPHSLAAPLKALGALLVVGFVVMVLAGNQGSLSRSSQFAASGLQLPDLPGVMSLGTNAFVQTDFSLPFALLIANGSLNTSLQAKVGDPMQYVWGSAGAVSASSYFTVDSNDDACGNKGGGYHNPWVASTLSGSSSGKIFACQAGHTYIITYTVKDVAGKTASASLTVSVAGTPAIPTPGAIIGHLDSLSFDAQGYFLTGWTCQVGVADSIGLHVYAGKSAYEKGTYTKIAGPANLTSETAINTKCKTPATSKHRFKVYLPASAIQTYQGQPIYVHGLRKIDGVQNSAITNSGTFKFPTPATTPLPAPSCALTSNPATITKGQSATLSWTSANATSGSINGGVGAMTPIASGAKSVSPQTTTTYTATVTGAGPTSGVGGGSGSTATCIATVAVSAASDTTPPTIFLGASTTSAQRGQTIALYASASDNVGVVGVQFKLDGANLVAEDTTSPFTASWNTTAASLGVHTLTAVARDAAGNRTTSSPRNITVLNAAQRPLAPTTPAPTNAATNQATSTLALSWANGGGATRYGVFVGTATNALTYKATQVGMSYTLSNLSASADYYWRVDAWNSAGTTTGAVWRFTTKAQPAAAPSCTLTPTPSTITKGQSATISWTSANATSGSINNGVGTMTPIASGAKSVSPQTTTTYAATVTGQGETKKCTGRVTVTNPPTSSVSIKLTGSVETVFDYSQSACEPGDLPDIPAHAFRDSSGIVNLLALNRLGYRMTGPTLNSVQRDCSSPILQSAKDPLQANARYQEWLISPYTTDGKNVYALVHNEWYAHLVDPKCSPNNSANGWVNSITLAASNNGGATYTHPADYKVWVSPVSWHTSYGCSPTNHTAYGSFHPTNIIKKDNYYYALYNSIPDPAGYVPGTRGNCLMRTADLSKASSWEKLTANGWDKSVQAKCKPVISNSAHPYTLTYNTYLKKYILIMERWNPQTQAAGMAYTLSSDLINWGPQVRIEGLPSGYIFASLLDPTDTSRNFENTGQDPYLYYVIYKDPNNYLDRDLVRQKVHITMTQASETDVFANLAAAATSVGAFFLNIWSFVLSLLGI